MPLWLVLDIFVPLLFVCKNQYKWVVLPSKSSLAPMICTSFKKFCQKFENWWTFALILLSFPVHFLASHGTPKINWSAPQLKPPWPFKLEFCCPNLPNKNSDFFLNWLITNKIWIKLVKSSKWPMFGPILRSHM